MQRSFDLNDQHDVAAFAALLTIGTVSHIVADFAAHVSSFYYNVGDHYAAGQLRLELDGQSLVSFELEGGRAVDEGDDNPLRLERSDFEFTVGDDLPTGRVKDGAEVLERLTELQHDGAATIAVEYDQDQLASLIAQLVLMDTGGEQYVVVEYDCDYSGGPYTGVGDNVYLTASLVAELGSVEAAFQQSTGIDPVHIVHYLYPEPNDAA